MKWLHGLLGIILYLTAFLFVLITGFEIAAYSDFGWYEKEYAKYDVCSDLDMEMEDVMDVTREMMAYLRGNRKDLNVDTIVAGKEQEFFNDREKAHMVDVQNLFIGGLWLRRAATVLFVAVLVVLLKTNSDWKNILPKSFLIGTVVTVGAVGGLAIAVAQDFNKVFTVFHEMFFTNDLWLLDPDTDLMIRMLPEGFFFDMVARIGVVLGVAMMVLMIGSAVMLVEKKRQSAKDGINVKS